jgi:hypothetical protein
METTSFEDGIGRRRRTTDPDGSEVETLLLCRELSSAESTEAALAARAAQLARFVHAAFAPVLRVERLSGGVGGLAVVSAAVSGTRLSEILRSAHRKLVAPDLDAARLILAQVTAALADFHRPSREISHGAIGPERIVMRPDGRAVIVEPILAPALQQLLMARTPLWTEFRVPVPPVAGTARFDQMTDVMQLGVLALALVLGRPIRRDEYPNRLHDLLMEASAADTLAERRPVSRALHSWIHRTLQLEPRSSFRTAADAVTAFEAVLAEGPRHRVSPAAVTRYMTACASEADSGSNAPAILCSPTSADEPHETVSTGAAPVPSPSPVEADGSSTGRLAVPGRFAALPRAEAESSLRHSARLASDAARQSFGLVRTVDWTVVRKGVWVSVLSLGLVALFGATYLGARGYLNLAGLTSGRGTLVVESRPDGVDLFVDGLASGRTPATLELRAGDHTLVLRTSRGITLVPVAVVAGARRVEHIDIRQSQSAPRAPAAATGRQAPTSTLPK